MAAEWGGGLHQDPKAPHYSLQDSAHTLGNLHSPEMSGFP